MRFLCARGLHWRAMDFFTVDIATLRWVVALVVVAVVMGVEWAVPFRIPIQSKLEHVSTNLIIFGGNSFIAQLLAGWTLLLWSSFVTSEGWGFLHSLDLSPVSHVLLSVIALDLVGYGIHRFYHRVPFFWRFHRAHHSDLDMDATTSICFHLGEVITTTGMKRAQRVGFGWLSRRVPHFRNPHAVCRLVRACQREIVEQARATTPSRDRDAYHALDSPFAPAVRAQCESLSGLLRVGPVVWHLLYG